VYLPGRLKVTTTPASPGYGRPAVNRDVGGVSPTRRLFWFRPQIAAIGTASSFNGCSKEHRVVGALASAAVLHRTRQVRSLHDPLERFWLTAYSIVQVTSSFGTASEAVTPFKPGRREGSPSKTRPGYCYPAAQPVMPWNFRAGSAARPEVPNKTQDARQVGPLPLPISIANIRPVVFLTSERIELDPRGRAESVTSWYTLCWVALNNLLKC
jgi:hypothetical protein